jgi:hypothetical protein
VRAVWGSLLLVAACGGPPIALEPAPPVTRKLTDGQFGNVIHDLFGDDVVVPTGIEPNTRLSGSVAMGTAVAALSPRGVEKYEEASFSIAAQVLDPARAGEVVTCADSAGPNDDCARAFVRDWGRRLWRRPLSTEELDRFVTIAGDAAGALGNFLDGLEFALAGLIQSPDLLMRPEPGEDAEGGRRYTAYEMASRLSFLLWDSAPDDALLDAAEQGLLLEPEGLKAEVERMVGDSRVRRGLRAWVEDWAHLDKLDHLVKDPTVFIYMNADLPVAAREETLRFMEDLVIDRDADLRDMLTTRNTFADRTLAAVYGVRASAREGFGPVELPADGPRLGLLGQVSYLATHAHPTSTSATQRGLFVRESLLCERTPPPPAGVSTQIPEATEDAPTRRERVDIHLTNPACATCHKAMDPIGLALENFDGVGAWRDTENGAQIDASGDLDGVPFADGEGLANAIRDHEHFVPCMVRQVARQALGINPDEGQDEALNALTEQFRKDSYSVKALWLQLALDPLFRSVGEVE